MKLIEPSIDNTRYCLTEYRCSVEQDAKSAEVQWSEMKYAFRRHLWEVCQLSNY